MKLTVRDLISIGIFSVIYFIGFMIAGMLGYIPVCVILLPFIAGVLGGIPFTLFVIKTQKFGAVTLLGLIVGLLTFLMGQTWMSVLFGVVFALAADLMMKADDYKNTKKNLAAYAVYTLWTIGTMLPMWIMRAEYFESYRNNGGTDAYIDSVMSLTPPYMIIVIAALGIVGAVIGGVIGKRVLKKHFAKAGIV